MENIVLGDIIQARIAYQDKRDLSTIINDDNDKENWFPAVVFGKNEKNCTVDLVVINAENYNVYPAAHEVKLKDIRTSNRKTLVIQNANVKNESTEKDQVTHNKVLFTSIIIRNVQKYFLCTHVA